MSTTETIERDARTTAAEFNSRNRWSCTAALALALEVLHDSNWHSLARSLKETAERQLQQEAEQENSCTA